MNAPIIELTRQPIDYAALIERVRHPRAGGLVLFLGTVRELTGDVETESLEYESHEPMALAKMELLAGEAKARWPVVELSLVHRLGKLSVGEVAVGVAVACPHRREAFEACQHIIDRLKEIVPIWKREQPPTGPGTWVHGV